MEDVPCTPIEASPTNMGYISGDTSYPLTQEMVDGGEHGYFPDEWEAITLGKGGATRYPLRDNHRRDCGHLLRTYMRYDTKLRRPVCAVDALIDLNTPAGREAWDKVRSGEYAHLSHGFDAKRIAGPRRYKNIFREVSLVNKPAHPEARILVRCSEDDPDDTDMSATPAQPQTQTQSQPSATPPPQAAPDDGKMDATEAAQLPSDAMDFVTSAPKDPREQLKFAHQHYTAAQEAQRRAAALEAENARLRDAAAKLEALEEQKRQALLAEQQGRLQAFMPMLQRHGLDTDASKQLLDELASSEHTVPIFESLKAAHAEMAEKEARLAKLEEEVKRNREIAEQAQALMGFLPQARGTGEKRSAARVDDPATRTPAKPKVEDPATTTRALAKPKIDAASATLLNLDKFQPKVMNKAVQAAAAPAQSSSSSSSSSSANVKTEDEEDDSGEIVLPESLEDYMRFVFTMSQQAPNAPIPVRCSEEDAKALRPVDPEKTIYGQDLLQPYEKLFFFSRQKEIDSMVAGLPGFCAHAYDSSGRLINEAALAKQHRVAAERVRMGLPMV